MLLRRGDALRSEHLIEIVKALQGGLAISCMLKDERDGKIVRVKVRILFSSSLLKQLAILVRLRTTGPSFSSIGLLFTAFFPIDLQKVAPVFEGGLPPHS